jgi:hypothetical protein
MKDISRTTAIQMVQSTTRFFSVWVVHTPNVLNSAQEYARITGLAKMMRASMMMMVMIHLNIS